MTSKNKGLTKRVIDRASVFSLLIFLFHSFVLSFLSPLVLFSVLSCHFFLFLYFLLSFLIFPCLFFSFLVFSSCFFCRLSFFLLFLSFSFSLAWFLACLLSLTIYCFVPLFLFILSLSKINKLNVSI